MNPIDGSSKLQFVMFFEDLRSERQLMSVVADSLSLRWYLGYDLHGQGLSLLSGDVRITVLSLGVSIIHSILLSS
jgi:hypothetical protein